MQKFNYLMIMLFMTQYMTVAQTKMISHKSHSGTKATFKKAIYLNRKDLSASNFGGPHTKSISLLDEVKVISKDKVVLKIRKSNTCIIYHTNYKTMKPNEFKVVYDTLTNHPVLNKKNPISLIKSRKDEFMFYDNPIIEVKFIGFND